MRFAFLEANFLRGLIPLITNKQGEVRTRYAALVCILIGVSLFSWLLPYAPNWNARLFDLLFQLRTELHLFLPEYDPRIVHVDLDDTTVQELGTYYIDRSHFSRVVTNLHQMGVSAQLHDFIFAAPANDEADQLLINAASEADHIYMGFAFRLKQDGDGSHYRDPSPAVRDHFLAADWSIEYHGEAATFLEAHDALLTFSPLGSAVTGLGFLNMTPDADGVYRRVPLLIRFGERFYPSMPFRAVCDYLGVTPDNIEIEPGRALLLKNAQDPQTSITQTIVIPVDNQNRLIVNFIGGWEVMNHYHFSDIWKASDDRDEMELWQEELAGKLVVVADVTTGSADIGAVPTDRAYPLGGLNASVLHTVLSQSFLVEVPEMVNLGSLLVFLTLVLLLSYTGSTIVFTVGTCGAILLFLTSGAMLFFGSNLIINFVSPLIGIILYFFVLQVSRALESARELRLVEMKRTLFEQELEIGRKIQADFFPDSLPEIPGWKIDAYFKPARQVAGDFYDVFPLNESGLTAIAVADVCDKGVGAALFMALTRSLIRATSRQLIGEVEADSEHLKEVLVRTAASTSDYIAENHPNTNMFATAFLGVLDPKKAQLCYVNGGHEPPLIVNKAGQFKELRPTGGALGLMPGMNFTAEMIRLDPGDILFAFTDGVTDAENSGGEQFGKQRLEQLLTEGLSDGSDLLTSVRSAVESHVANEETQFDDITMVAVTRQSDDAA